ncbi:hypothetical protein [Lactobacillus johnsonii]|uniref:Uncharacterized protein n=1 Tax=Lactobacillus johnsonii ATCC 33200 TaxID=525330 RepID=C2E6Z0_LACJH|nr:hypothetical protein [Lactobacillus johnsonii]EEJ59358.1 hypothetical protein HMPREF0528_1514 [Lactobacillus johnsonii ATCC 33200]KRK56147.1 hypothetical protein FC22_GL000295 [Lactobacillus johnsonii ATCC 33200]MCF0083756.1 hypothetical protein [Lactobacillus johnsonii]MCT3323034.1 hypothetical protein [Lactobacillus johnsonii]MCT3380399.1 hypothetical protein [Lactobacillus johnsonii]
MEKGKKEKILEFLEETKNAVKSGRVDTVIISAYGKDLILHVAGKPPTLLGLTEIQHKNIEELITEYES